jgi:P-type conjugative transfer protein TrbJ
MRQLKKYLVSFFLVIVPLVSYGNMPVIDATNLIQNTTTAAQTTATAASTASMLANQVQQLQMDVDNIQNYSGYSSWQSTLANELNELSSIVSQGNALSQNMQNSAANFNQNYPGYQSTQNYPQAYQAWSTSTMSTFQNTLQNAGLQLSDLQNDQTTLNALQNLNNSPQGRLQAIQVGNNLTALVANQMLQLRQLIANQTNAQSTYLAYQVQKEQTQQATAAAWVNAGDTTWPGYGNDGGGFGPNNLPNVSR